MTTKPAYHLAVAYVLLGLAPFSLRSEGLDGSLSFSSNVEQTQLIELYTSQGCSSCPPAERKLNARISEPGLFTEFIPLAFHVDYWDRLGWKDPFASKENTQRQYLLKGAGQFSSVYTPAFLVDGKEWRGFFRGEAWPTKKSKNGGILTVAIERHELTLTHPELGTNTIVDIAILGAGFETLVNRGENRNKRLEQDFVVIWHKTTRKSDSIELPALASLPTANRYAIAVWISDKSTFKPIQAAASWIK